jgi:hypothetical protein
MAAVGRLRWGGIHIAWRRALKSPKLPPDLPPTRPVNDLATAGTDLVGIKQIPSRVSRATNLECRKSFSFPKLRSLCRARGHVKAICRKNPSFAT